VSPPTRNFQEWAISTTVALPPARRFDDDVDRVPVRENVVVNLRLVGEELHSRLAVDSFGILGRYSWRALLMEPANESRLPSQLYMNRSTWNDSYTERPFYGYSFAPRLPPADSVS
jgi:hypothetical protein